MKTVPNSPYPICIPSNLTGFIQNKGVCVPNDQTGLDLCNYICGVEKTLNVTGIYQSNTASSNVLMHYPYYTQQDGEKFYFCYNKIGDNLLEGLYNTPTVGSDFVFPKECFTRHITNFSEYGVLGLENTYNSSYLTLNPKLSPETSSFDISTDTYVALPLSYNQTGPILEFTITKPGSGYSNGEKLTFESGDNTTAYMIIDGGLGPSGELNADIGYYTFNEGTSYSLGDTINLTGGKGGEVSITKVDDNGSLMLAKVGIEFMKVMSIKNNVRTITSLPVQYYLYSKTV
jgi:hypothetical protein